MRSGFYNLRVGATRQEINGAAKSVLFDVPGELNDTFRWRPGQHVTLRFIIGGNDVRRSYSVSSSPLSGDPLQITVKRVDGGLVSNHIVSNIAPGDRIDVMAPFGGFCLDPASNH